jgi:hypothetical protein
MHMGLFNNLFGEDEKNKLFQLSNFEGNYLVSVNNEFIMGRDNPAISLQTTSQISLAQKIEESVIRTAITTQTITGSTESDTMKPHLQQALLLGGISKTIDFIRNEKGKITCIANKKQLESEWLLWKETTLPQLYPDKTEQVKFAENYEKGLELMGESIPDNLHHFMLQPDIYHVRNHVSQSRSNASSTRLLPSKLIAGMVIKYHFVTTEVEYGDQSVIRLKAEIQNEGEMLQKFLKKLYKAQSEFNQAEYAFTIDVDYLMESNSGKIISGNLFLKEKMHNHLQYILHIQVKEIKEENPAPQHTATRKPRRNLLADEITNEQE